MLAICIGQDPSLVTHVVHDPPSPLQGGTVPQPMSDLRASPPISREAARSIAVQDLTDDGRPRGPCQRCDSSLVFCIALELTAGRQRKRLNVCSSHADRIRQLPALLLDRFRGGRSVMQCLSKNTPAPTIRCRSIMVQLSPDPSRCSPEPAVEEQVGRRPHRTLGSTYPPSSAVRVTLMARPSKTLIVRTHSS